MEGQARIETVNNDFYEELGEEWIHRFDHPIALLRAENETRIPWILEEIRMEKASVLDIGCGAGFLTNRLAKAGHIVSGIDLSEKSLAIAKKYDATGTVDYQKANAYCLPYPDRHFDAVCAMDVLEHVDDPQLLIAEASRVLKQDGLFFFHTFNRNLLSYFLIIKGVEWAVPNTPKNMHVYPLFIKPSELDEICHFYELKVKSFLGLNPKLSFSIIWKMFTTRRVPEDFKFYFTKSLRTGYCGVAQKSMYR